MQIITNQFSSSFFKKFARKTQLIIQRGGKFTISDDSHGPLKVGQNYDKLYNYLKEFNIDTLYYLDYDDESENNNDKITMIDNAGKGEGGVANDMNEMENLGSGRKLVVKEMKNVLNHSFWDQFL